MGKKKGKKGKSPKKVKKADVPYEPPKPVPKHPPVGPWQFELHRELIWRPRGPEPRKTSATLRIGPELHLLMLIQTHKVVREGAKSPEGTKDDSELELPPVDVVFAKKGAPRLGNTAEFGMSPKSPGFKERPGARTERKRRDPPIVGKVVTKNTEELLARLSEEEYARLMDALLSAREAYGDIPEMSPVPPLGVHEHTGESWSMSRIRYSAPEDQEFSSCQFLVQHLQPSEELARLLPAVRYSRPAYTTMPRQLPKETFEPPKDGKKESPYKQTVREHEAMLELRGDPKPRVREARALLAIVDQLLHARGFKMLPWDVETRRKPMKDAGLKFNGSKHTGADFHHITSLSGSMDGVRAEHNPVLRNGYPETFPAVAVSSRRKATLCDWFRRCKPCPYGDRCTFAHSTMELLPRSLPIPAPPPPDFPRPPSGSMRQTMQNKYEHRLEHALFKGSLADDVVETRRKLQLKERRRRAIIAEKEEAKRRANRLERLQIILAVERFEKLPANAQEEDPNGYWQAKENMKHMLEQKAELWATIKQEEREIKIKTKAVVRLQAWYRGWQGRRRMEAHSAGGLLRSWYGGADSCKVETVMRRRGEISDPPPTLQEIKEMLIKMGNHAGLTLSQLKIKKANEAAAAKALQDINAMQARMDANAAQVEAEFAQAELLKDAAEPDTTGQMHSPVDSPVHAPPGQPAGWDSAPGDDTWGTQDRAIRTSSQSSGVDIDTDVDLKPSDGITGPPPEVSGQELLHMQEHVRNANVERVERAGEFGGGGRSGFTSVVFQAAKPSVDPKLFGEGSPRHVLSRMSSRISFRAESSMTHLEFVDVVDKVDEILEAEDIENP